jgi:hypothetical protein
VLRADRLHHTTVNLLVVAVSSWLSSPRLRPGQCRGDAALLFGAHAPVR